MAIDSILLNGLVFLFLFFVFYRTTVVRPFDQINNGYLSLENCLSYRGVAAIVVFLSHAAAFVNDKSDAFLFNFFAVVGYLSVAIFFFLSGYGVMKKYMIDENYEKTFLKKRMCSLLVPYAFFLILYWCYRNLYGFVSPKDVLNTYITGLPIVSCSWYVVVIFLFYILFFLQIKVFKRKYKYFVISGILFNLIWIFLCRKMEYGIHWYNTIHVILIGYIWAMKETKIKGSMIKHKILYIYSYNTFTTFTLLHFWNKYSKKNIIFCTYKVFNASVWHIYINYFCIVCTVF